LSSRTSTPTAARPIWTRRGSITGASNGDATRTLEVLPENIIPGWGGNPQTFEGLAGVTGLVIGSAEGAIDFDSIEIVYGP
jgi:hypothetical protein